MSIDFSLHKNKDTQSELTVTLDASELQAAVKQAMEGLRQAVKADGYRPGKAPDDVVKKLVGEDRVKEEALNIAIEQGVHKAVTEQHLEVMEFGGLDIKENTPDKLVFVAKILLFPEVTLGDGYKKIHIDSKPITVTDTDVEGTLEEIKKMRTEYAPSDAPAQEGDRVEVDFEVKDGDTVIEGGKSDNHPVIIGRGGFVPGFEDQIKGMNPTETKHFSLTMPKDYYEKSVAGKTLDFTVTVKKIERPIPVTLDDEFAQGVGNFATFDELKENIRAGILEEKKAKETERVKLAVIDKILESAQVEVPDVLRQRQLDLMMADFDKELHGRGMELGLYLKHINKTQDELRASFVEQADKRVVTSLALREIGKLESIVVTDEEINDRLNEINAAINIDEEMIKRKLGVEELKSRIRQALFDEKVFTFLMRNVVIQ